MALKIFCDRCKKEIKQQNSNEYRKIYCMYGEDDGTEEWDLCPDCFISIKRSIILNIMDYETAQNNASSSNEKNRYRRNDPVNML